MDDTEDTKLKVVARSNGRTFLIVALIATIGAVVCIFIASTVDVPTYDPSSEADALLERWRFMAVGSGLFGLAALMFAVGSIVRALWFLPGAETKAIPEIAPNRHSVNSR